MNVWMGGFPVDLASSNLVCLSIHSFSLLFPKVAPGKPRHFFSTKNNGGTHYSPSLYSAIAPRITFILLYHLPLYWVHTYIWFDNTRRASSPRISAYHRNIAFSPADEGIPPNSTIDQVWPIHHRRAQHPRISPPFATIISLPFV